MATQNIKDLVLKDFKPIDELVGPLTVLRTVLRTKQHVKKVLKKNNDESFPAYGKPLGYVVSDSTGRIVCLERQEAIDACLYLDSTNTSILPKKVKGPGGKQTVLIYMRGIDGLSLQSEAMIVYLNYLLENSIPVSESFDKSLKVKSQTPKRSASKYTREDLIELVKSRRADL